MDDEIRSSLIDIYNKHKEKGGWKKVLSSKSNKLLLDKLIDEYPKPESIAENRYWLIHNLTQYPVCPTCENFITSFKNINSGYFEHCCCRCAQLDKNVREKNKNSCIDRYGVENGAQSCVSKEKYQKTCEEKYGEGIINSFMAEQVKEKIRTTMMNKYSCENPSQSPDIVNKRRQTLMDRYGITIRFANSQNYFHSSKGEIELLEYIESISKYKVNHTDRKIIFPMELDIYIPEIQVAFEYDGDYWHSLPDMKERDMQKDRICQDKNILLVRVLESEWQQHKIEVQNYILNLLSVE